MSIDPHYDVLDAALDEISGYGPDLRNGLTNHAPMTVEALCALGRADAVQSWLAAYREGMLPRPPRHQPIALDDWRNALAQADRSEDWAAFFTERLRETAWQEVVGAWGTLLAPGICAAAAHGVIRVGHAVRSLAQEETVPRRNELANALGYWAANYQELPAASIPAARLRPASEAILQVPIQPAGERRFTGTIVSSLEGLHDFPPFAGVIHLAQLDGDPAMRIVELSEIFARVYLANVHDTLTSIVFVHGITSLVALDHLLPYLDEPAAQATLRFAWQASCGLYTAFGSKPPEAAVPTISAPPATLIERAIAHGDEHVIKLTEACLQQYARNPAPAYLAAAYDVSARLPRPK